MGGKLWPRLKKTKNQERFLNSILSDVELVLGST